MTKGEGASKSRNENAAKTEGGGGGNLSPRTKYPIARTRARQVAPTLKPRKKNPPMKVEKIEYKTARVDELQTFNGNPRQGDISAIVDSLRARGQYRPIVVNRGTHTGREMEVLAGNHTLAAARSIGWTHIDVGIVDVDDETAKGIVLADNRLADLGGYDEEALAALLSDLDDLTGTGYSEEDLNAILAAQEIPVENTDRDDAPALPAGDTISVPGDVYELGPHRVWCGDSTDAAGVAENLLHDGLADCVWTDPPYGVSYVGKTKDSLTIENDGAEGLAELLQGAMGTLVVSAVEGAPVYVAHADTERVTFETAMRDAGMLVRQNLVWVKNTLVMGRSDYHYKHEPILYGFTPGGTGRLGRGGPRWYGDNKQTTVLEYSKPSQNSDHPTMKPVDLVIAMLKNSCPPGGKVLDLFGGSGSTLIAAHHLGAKARLVELDPRYVDVICRRWQAHTGVVPVRDGEEVSFL